MCDLAASIGTLKISFIPLSNEINMSICTDEQVHLAPRVLVFARVVVRGGLADAGAEIASDGLARAKRGCNSIPQISKPGV